IIGKRVDCPVCYMRAPVAEADCVAIGCGASYSSNTYAPGGTGCVLHQHTLPERSAHPIGNDPRKRIGRSTDGVSDFHRDPPRRILLCPRASTNGEGRGRCSDELKQPMATKAHNDSLVRKRD